MFGKVWFLKRYHSNNQCIVTKSKFTGYYISDLIKFQCKDIFVYKLKTLLPTRTLFCKFDKKNLKISAKGQGQGHRSEKLT